MLTVLLVWSVCGGKTRVLIGAADSFTEDTMEGFRTAAQVQIEAARPLDLATLRTEQARLVKRQS